ncbi:NYN domain-containing protein [Mycena haematopus]|nr:NYN domain-containing protein [Mycena haematopus]
MALPFLVGITLLQRAFLSTSTFSCSRTTPGPPMWQYSGIMVDSDTFHFQAHNSVYTENCRASSQLSGYEIVSGIRNVAHRFGPVKQFKAYMEVPDPDTSRSLSLRSELQSSGVSLTDCPRNGRKNVADQMIMVDMLAYAMDHPAPVTLILISGDRDFAYAVSVLRLRRYEVVVISPPLPGAHISLKSQASVYLDWNAEVLGYSSFSSEPAGRAESPSAIRNSFNCQSPNAHRTSYLPTPGTPYPRDIKLPSKHDAAAVPGPSRSASYFEDPFSPKVASPEPTVVPPSVSISASASERPHKLPGLQERPEVVAAPPYFAKVSQEPEENNVEAVTAPVQSTSTPPLAHVLENKGDVIATPANAQSTPTAPPLCSRATVEARQPLTKTPPPEPCPLPSAFTACATVAGSSINATMPAERNTDEKIAGDDHPPELILDEDSSRQAPKSPIQLSGSPISLDHIPNSTVHAVKPDPPVAPIPPLDTAPAEEKQLPKHVTPTFQPLMDILLKYSAKGITRPLRSTVGSELVGLAATVYKQAGVKNFSQLTALAEQEKFVQMGGSDGNAWISLHRDWSTSVVETAASQSVPPSSSTTQRKVPPVYQILVDALEKCRANGIVRPLRSVIAIDIVAKDSKVYARAGVKKFREFAALAEKDKIVAVGGTQGDAWISLHPDWYK